MIEDELSCLVDPATSERDKDAAVAAAVLKMSGLCVKIARMHAKYPGLVWSRDGDDLVQLVQELAMKKLRKIAVEGQQAGLNFESNLARSARGVIRDYADSGQNTMVARGGAAHRQARVDFVREQADALLRSPAAPSTSNRNFMSVKFDNDADAVSNIDASAHLEMQSTVDRVIDRCARSDSPAMLLVARCMFSWFPDGSPPSVADIAKQLGQPYSTVKRRHDNVVAIFKQENALEDDVRRRGH